MKSSPAATAVVYSTSKSRVLKLERRGRYVYKGIVYDEANDRERLFDHCENAIAWVASQTTNYSSRATLN